MAKENKTETDRVLEEDIDRWYREYPQKHSVVAIGEPHHFEEVFCYLVKGRDRDLLIDTGMGVKLLSPFIDQHRNTSKELVVINTHWHYDHVGGNREFAKILVPKNEHEVEGVRRGWERKDLDRYSFFDGFWHGGWPTGFYKESFYIPGVTNIKSVLVEGHTIDLGDRIIKVIETPGHTPGSISLLDNQNGLLFTSDLLYQGPLYCFEEESSLQDYFASLKKLQGMKQGIKVLHPGHNYPSNSPVLIDQALEIFERVRNGEKPDDEKDGIAIYIHPKVDRLKVLAKKRLEA